MVEYTSFMSVKDIEARGYKDIGYRESTSPYVSQMILRGTIQNKADIFIRNIDKEGKVVQIFEKINRG